MSALVAVGVLSVVMLILAVALAYAAINGDHNSDQLLFLVIGLAVVSTCLYYVVKESR